METILCKDETNGLDIVNHYSIQCEDSDVFAVISTKPNEDVSEKIMEAIKEEHDATKIKFHVFEYFGDFKCGVSAEVFHGEDDDQYSDMIYFFLAKIPVY